MCAVIVAVPHHIKFLKNTTILVRIPPLQQLIHFSLAPLESWSRFSFWMS